jgi:tetratricopeptide (TPR) repeat protein
VIIDGRVMSIGRHAGVRVSAWSDGTRVPIWVASLRRRALEDERLRELAEAITVALRTRLGRSDQTARLPGESAQTAGLQGRFHLDQSRTELNVKRAITRFEAALRDEPDYAAAHAGLCRALVQESLISSEPRILPDAERACARAHELAPELAAVRLARAELARRTGRNEQAEGILQALLDEDADHVEALINRAENALAIYRRTGHAADRTAAVAFAERASALEPDFWKAPFTLARIHFFTGDIDAAIAAGKAAVAADANEHSVTNLGTSYFCRGDHEIALEQYLHARDITPDASLGEEQMCVAFYFARDFDRAVAACEAAIELDRAGGSPARHEMWGNLADAYRQAQRTVDAADAYARAAELAERALLTRGHSPNLRAHLAYYYVALRALAPERVPELIGGKLEGELTDALESTTDPQAHIRIASAWALLGRSDQARTALAAGTADCPGFGASPDLEDVRL